MTQPQERYEQWRDDQRESGSSRLPQEQAQPGYGEVSANEARSTASDRLAQFRSRYADQKRREQERAERPREQAPQPSQQPRQDYREQAPQQPRQDYRDQPQQQRQDYRDQQYRDEPEYRGQAPRQDYREQPRQDYREQPGRDYREQQYRDDYREQPRQDYRDQQYRDDYRQDYRDQTRQDYRERPRQDYREQPQQDYRDQQDYRADYRNQPRQDYRDDYRDQQDYRDDYREQPQQDYRDDYRDDYRGPQQYQDEPDYRDQDTGDYDYGYAGQTTQPSPVYEDAARAFNDVEPLDDTPSRDPYGGAADADWDDMDDVDTAEADDMYPVDKPSFADLDAVDDEPDNKVENTGPKTGGLMGWLRRVTRRGETVNTEQYIASMNRKLRQPQVIGIMGSKGGVGKTSKSQVIGSILSHYRTEGGVVAADLDANSTLIQRMKPQTPLSDNASIHTFAHDESIHSAADVNSYLVLNEEKLAVLAGVGMTGSAPLRKDELQRVLTRLGEYYTLIILDFPGSAEVPVAMHALKVIDAMVYVAEITSSSLSATKRDLKRIANVRPELLSTATIILNHRTSGKVHIKNLEGHVEDFRNMGTKDTATGASLVKVFETNFDPHIGIEGPIHISQLDPVNRTRYMQIAASIMDSLPGNTPGYMRYAADLAQQVQDQVEQQGGDDVIDV